MRRRVLLLMAVSLVLGSLVAVSQARAESSKAVLVPVSCDSGPYPSLYTTLPPYGEAVSVVGSTVNLITVTLSVRYADGSTAVLHSSNADPKGLVTCHSVGPVTGNHYTLVGFFTPAA